MSLPKLAKQFRNVALAAMWFALAAVAAGAVLQGVTMVGVVTGAGTGRHCEPFPVSDPVNSYQFPIASEDQATTAVSIQCQVDPNDSGESVDVVLYQCTQGTDCDTITLATEGLNGATVVNCDNDGTLFTGPFSNGSVGADKWVGIDIGTVTGTVSFLSLRYCYDK